MNVIIDPGAGFCWGVIRTVQIAEETLSEHATKPVYVLGHIIHNPREIERLEAKDSARLLAMKFPCCLQDRRCSSVRTVSHPKHTG